MVRARGLAAVVSVTVTVTPARPVFLHSPSPGRRGYFPRFSLRCHGANLMAPGFWRIFILFLNARCLFPCEHDGSARQAEETLKRKPVTASGRSARAAPGSGPPGSENRPVGVATQVTEYA